MLRTTAHSHDAADLPVPELEGESGSDMASHPNKRGVSVACEDPSMRCSSARHIAHIADMINTCKSLDGKYEVERPLGKPNALLVLYTGSLFYLTSVICHVLSCVWAVGCVGCVKVTREPRGSGTGFFQIK